MWKQEILEFLNDTGQQDVYFEEIAKSVLESQVFFFGEIDPYNSIIASVRINDLPKKSPVPYNLTLVEWIETKPILNKETQEPAPKRAVLVFTDDIITEQSYFSFYGEQNEWCMSPVAWGCNNSSEGMFDWSNSNIQEKLDKATLEAVCNEAMCDFYYAKMFLDILNKPNIVTKEIIPPEKVNIKRKKRNKLPLYSYKIIEISKEKVTKKNVGSEKWGYKSPIEKRYHYVRGHTKVYTKEKPLFGKTWGEFKWKEQVRGNKTLGIIEKEYHVKKDKK